MLFVGTLGLQRFIDYWSVMCHRHHSVDGTRAVQKIFYMTKVQAATASNPLQLQKKITEQGTNWHEKKIKVTYVQQSH